MNRLRSIAIEEQRQLITLGFAVLVFLMTLWALQLHQGATLNRDVSANGASASHASIAGPANRTVALSATTSIGSR